MTVTAVADTHGFLRYFYSDPRLSSRVKSFIDSQRDNANQVGVSAITLVEILYLSEKGRIPADAFAEVMDYVERPESPFVEVALNRSVALSLEKIDRNAVPDMPDRIIVATVLHLGVPLISRDGRIRASNVETVW